MTKSLKEQAREKAQKATVMFWDSKGTANITKVRKSINQKVERSEQDIKTALFPLTVATILNLLLLLTLVVR